MAGMQWVRVVAGAAKRCTLRQAPQFFHGTEQVACLIAGGRNFASPCVKETTPVQKQAVLQEKSAHRQMEEDASCTTPCETSCTVTLPPDISCWSCHKARGTSRCADNLFCPSCGHIQPPAPKCNFFDLIGVKDEKYDIDLKELDQKYKNLMRKLHPDLYMQKERKELEFSQAQASVVNVAYRTLHCPFKRAEYMLRRMGVNYENETSAADPEFMMEVLEANSRIEDAHRDQKKLKEVRDDFYLPYLRESMEEFNKAYKDGDVHKAAVVMARLQYLKRVNQQLHHVIDVA